MEGAPLLFDCNGQLGRWPTQAPGAPTTAAEMVAALGTWEIERAVVYHALARYYSPAEGNRRLLGEIAGHEALVPAWVLLPHWTEELPTARGLVAAMVAGGACVARLFPTQHRFSLSPWSCDDLLAALAERRVPLLLDFGGVHWSERATDWDAVARICGEYATLPLVLVHQGMGNNRFLYPLLERYGNLFVETSYFQPHRGLEDVCRRFGPDRLLFGTGMPIYAPGPPISMLAYSRITPEERAAIGGGTLARLIAGVERG